MHTNLSWAFRAPSRDDADEITRLIQAENVEVSGEPDFDASDLEADWGMAGFDPGRNALVALKGGAIAAYGSWRARRPHADYDVSLSVHPAHADAAMERALLDALEGLVREDLTAAPPGAREMVHVHADREEKARLALFEQAGYAPCRWYFSMGIEMKAEPVPMAPPAGVEIRPVRQGVEEPIAYAVLRDAFRGHYRFTPLEQDDWLRRHAGYDFYVPGLWQIAWHGERAIGAACNLFYDDVGMVDELGVHEDWRGKKVGRALLEASFAAFWKKGQPNVRLVVDAGNETGATQLYERAGMHVIRTYAQYRKEVAANE